MFTTDLEASAAWAIEAFARRWSIAVLFWASKQVMDVEGPQHGCRQSIEKLAPWVWLMQTVVSVWYVGGGHALPEAQAARENMGSRESEWSLRPMLKLLRQSILEQTITDKSAIGDDFAQIMQLLKPRKSCGLSRRKNAKAQVGSASHRSLQ